jgi:hypothetical protein
MTTAWRNCVITILLRQDEYGMEEKKRCSKLCFVVVATSESDEDGLRDYYRLCLVAIDFEDHGTRDDISFEPVCATPG